MEEKIQIKKTIEAERLNQKELTETEAIWKSLGEYYILFCKRWYLIIAFCIVGGLVSYYKIAGVKTKYVAEVKFASSVDDNSGGYSLLAQQFGLASKASSVFSGDNLLNLMKTPSLVNMALMTTVKINDKPVMLIDYYLNNKGIRNEWATKNPALANLTFTKDIDKNTRQQDSLLKGIISGIIPSLNVAKQDKELAFITLKVEDEDPIWAKYFSETLVRTVTDYYVALTTAKVAENVRIFQAEVDSFSRAFGKSLSSIATSQDINVNPTKQVANVGIQQQQISMSGNNALYGEMLKNLELSKVQLQKQTPFIQIIETPKFPLDTTQSNVSKAVLIGLITGFIIAIISIVLIKECTNILKKLKKASKQLQ